MTAPPVRLSFVIPVRNDARRLANCLRSIASNDHQSMAVEIIVADNGSTDGTPEAARAAGAQVFSWPGLRVSELRNHGAAAASGEVLAFVDADHEIAANWISAAVETLAADRTAAVGALYTAPAPGTWVQRLYGVLRGRTVGRQDVGWLGSGNLAVRRGVFESVGGFDEALEACEDVDLCQRLRSAGWRVVADERLKSVHLGDPPTLAALFRAERWRGRDNLRVTLRGRLTIGDLPSLVIPIVDLIAGAALVGSLLSWPFVGSRVIPVIVGSVVVVGVLAAARTISVLVRAGLSGPLTMIQAFLVVLTYDAARAIALVTRASHHRAIPQGPSTARAPIT